MSKTEVNAPVSSVACDRLVLGVGWVRPGAGGIGATLSPAVSANGKGMMCGCFEGTEE
jgi:hypothetical protein